MNSTQHTLAIIGVGCRFPGNANSPQELWQLLLDGRDAVTSIPPDRFDLDRFTHPDRKAPGRACTAAAGVIEDVTGFDAAFFGMSPAEAENLDPQQRLVLEMTWEAFEDAGIPPSSVAGSRAAVFIGAASTDMGVCRADDPCVMGPYSMTGTSLGIIANRVSYLFDLHGPSMTIDTACSSSLVALHQACRAVLDDDLPLAVAGGVNILLSPFPFIGFSKAHMLSKDGRCKVFDASGNGYVRAEGGGVVLIKRLDRALTDGDRIHAIIRATGVNSDGRTTGIALPNGAAQAELLRSLYTAHDIDPAQLAYVEAHGTGTAVGDPIETASIGEVLGRPRPSDRPLPVGSVKSNLGHLETGSGMAGLIKALCVLKYKTIPANLHLDTPNPAIDFAGLNITVPTTAAPLPRTDEPALVGVNSFGFGGTNAHVILEEAPAQTKAEGPRPAEANSPSLLLSARSQASLARLAEAHARLLSQDATLSVAEMAANVAWRREQLDSRLVVTATDKAAMIEGLSAFARDREPIATDTFRVHQGDVACARGETVFVFSGNGCQWAGMGSALLDTEEAFTQAIAEIDTLLGPLQGWSVADRLRMPIQDWGLEHTEVAQPLLFAIQIGLTRSLESKGVIPDAVYGHSVGEVAAAHVCGALSLADACTVIHHRSHLQEQTFGSGGMAAMNITPEQAQALADASGGAVELAAVNSEASVTMAGELAVLQGIEQEILAEKGFCKVLPLAYPFHSRFMDVLEAPLREALAGIRPGPASVRFISTVTGADMPGEELDAAYWWRNIRKPVSFLRATRSVLESGARILLEIGAHGVLQFYVKDTIRASKVRACVLPTLKRDANCAEMLETAWRQAHVSGWPLDLARLHPKPTRRIDLPTYPWDRERLWLPTTTESAGFLSARRIHPLLGWKLADGVETYENTLDTQLFPWLAGHVVAGAVLFPAAGFIELCHAACRLHDPEAEAVEIANLDLRRPLVLSPAPAKKIRLTLDTSGSMRLASKTMLTSEDWLPHGTARMCPCDTARPEPVDLDQFRRTATAAPVRSLYETARDMGLAYAPPFTPVTAAWRNGPSVLAELTLADATENGLHLDPPLVDGAFQALFLLLAEHLPRHHRAPYLPSWFGRMLFFAPGQPRHARATLLRVSTRSVVASFELYDATGNVLARFEDCRFRRADWRSASAPEACAYRTQFEPCQHPTAPSVPLLPEPSALAEVLAPVLDDLSQRFHRAEYYATVLPLCQAATIALAHEVAKPLAAFGAFKIDDGVRMELLKTEHIPYLVFILELLESQGLAVRQDETWRVIEDSDLPPSLTLWRTIVADYPAHLPEAVLVGRIGLHLREILRGDMTSEDILGQEQGGTIEHFYANAPSIRLINETTLTLMRHVLDRCPQGHRVRILEVGAAPGGLLSAIMPALTPRRCEYVVSDKDAAALEHLEAVWGEHKGLSFRVLDMEDPGPQDGPGFDLILAGQCLHAAESVDRALRGCLSLLAPGGLLVSLKRGPSDLQDMIQGVDPQWWSRSSSPAEPASRLLSQDSWVRAFRHAGFEHVQTVQEPCDGHEPDSFLVLGRKPAVAGQQAHIPQAQPETTWLILADAPADNLATALRKALSEAGARVRGLTSTGPESDPDGLTVPDSDEQWRELFRSVAESGKIECVHLLGLDSRPDCPAAELHALSLHRLTTATAMAQAWEDTGRPSCRFWLVTGGCQEVEGELLLPAMSQAPLWGFGRVLQNEMPGLDTRLIDIHGDTIAPALARELLAPSEDREIVLIGDRRYRAKVLAFDPTPARPAPRGLADAISLVFDTPGKLDRLYWRQTPRHLPGPGEVQVQTMATGLNFRDVMWAMGMLPDEALENGFSGPTMGLECSGVISAVGAGVTEVQVGDEVVCFAPACFGAFVTTTENAVAPKPETLTHEEAATIPVAFFTAYYALKHLAAAEPGERVLIHGAAGGVGLAAIQIARHLGLDIIATAGSDEKRDFLSLLGVERIFDSRSLRFADDILASTDGQGVDMVLNSLHGKAIAKGLDVLRPFGRFLELGKRDFYGDSPLFLRPFRNNISYFGIDVDQLLTARPRLARRLFAELMALFEQRVLRPLPHRIFSRANAAEAFRVMQQSRHMGKLVISFDEHTQGVRPTPLAAPRLPIDIGGAYLITGGLGGFGLKVAERLADDGAKTLILLGRAGVTDAETARIVDGLRQRGVAVHVARADVADEAGLTQALDEILAQTGPLKGIVHAAGILDDAVILNQTSERMGRVWRVKALGAWNLHQLSLAHALDFFILFSSATTLLGNPGQSNYVAANCALESLAAYRRALGLPALAVGWGPIGDVGMLVRDPKALESLKTILGVSPLSAREALDLLERLHWRGVTAPAVFSIDWKKIRHLPAAASGRFNGLLKGAGPDRSSGGRSIMDEISGKSRDEALAILARSIAEEAAGILRIPASRVDVNAPVAEFGMDSLMAVELGIALEERFGLEAPTISLAGGASVLTIAERFLEAMTGPEAQDADTRMLATMQLQHGSRISQELSNGLRAELATEGTTHD